MKNRTVFLFMSLAVIAAAGCSPGGYRFLSVFFDGVPQPDAASKAASADTTAVRTALAAPADTSKKAAPAYFVHAPYDQHDCNSCHDKSLGGKLVNPQPGLCYNCHEDFGTKFSNVHGPVAGGYCTECHLPHASKLPRLLKEKGQKLCLRCHTVAAVMKNSAHSEIGDADCTECHDPHGGSNRFMIK